MVKAERIVKETLYDYRELFRAKEYTNSFGENDVFKTMSLNETDLLYKRDVRAMKKYVNNRIKDIVLAYELFGKITKLQKLDYLCYYQILKTLDVVEVSD